MPVAGPISALVLARGLAGRFQAACAISVGAAVAEAGYAFLAFFGFSTLLVTYPAILPITRAMAAAILVTLGLILLLRRVKVGEERGLDQSTDLDHILGGAAQGFLICALNPTLLATWTAASATLASSGLLEITPRLALPFALSVCLGIVTWFLVLLGLLRRYRDRFKAETLVKAVRVIGVALVLLGCYFAFLSVQWLVR